MADIVDWIEEELKKRGWNRNNLANQSGVDSGYVSRILNRERNPGPETLEAFARAFGYPKETVYRAAGKLDPQPEIETEFDEWRHVLAQLSARDRQELLGIARLKLEGTSESWKNLVDLYDQVPEESQGKAVRDAADVIEEYLKEIGAKRIK